MRKDRVEVTAAPFERAGLHIAGDLNRERHFGFRGLDAELCEQREQLRIGAFVQHQKTGVDAVSDQRDFLEAIFRYMNWASVVALAIAGVMIFCAILLIATTIRLSAFSRRRELGIMRLVGASNRFIQTPFILEGVFAALIGSLLAGGATVAIVHYFVQGVLGPGLVGTSLVNLQDALLVVPILLGVGVVLAVVSANFAISRYLKI